MDVVATDVERYSDANAFAKEVNLPLLGTAALPPVRPEATLSELLAASSAEGLEPIVENLAQTRQSLTLRSLLLAGFPHDPECFALGLALGRAWSRRGLKVAVVDMDAWNPTIVRGVDEPAEGLVDVLEYGCSFQRVAWELVAGSLWVVGPGMHPTDESRLADHPEWDRAARVFSARADVTLYVAPLLHKPGLTGRLSKRMDGVLLTASVDRVSRVELRDAFLELWGSDAPIIGAVAIDPRSPRPTAAEAASSPALARLSRFVEESRERDRDRAIAPAATETPAYDAGEEDDDDSALLAALDREVRLGAVADRAHRHRRTDWLWRGLAAAVIALAGVAAWIGFLAPTEERIDSRGTRPTGEETVLPAPQVVEPPPAATPPAAPVTAALGAGAPLSTAPPVDGKKFRVHVASFRSEEKVAPIVRDLRLKGLDAWFEPATDAPGWYRVFVGRFATEDEAKAYATWLLQNKWVERAHAFPSTSR